MIGVCLLSGSYAIGKKNAAVEKGRFGIYVDGKEIGEETFTIQESDDSFRSESVVAFKNPGPSAQDVKIETQLTMDENYMPKSYQVRSSMGGNTREIAGEFVAGKATFKYPLQGAARQQGLLMEDYYVMLDANVFHHFTFIGRLAEFDNAASIQALDVVIPQEMNSGVLEIRDAGPDTIVVYGKKIESRRLNASTGKKNLVLWVDRQRVLQKIAFPEKKIEVMRKR